MEQLASLGFSCITEGPAALWYHTTRPELASIVPLVGPVGQPSALNGRGQIRILGDDYVVRHLEHGGALRSLSGDRFLRATRCVREAAASDHLRSRGIPTPEIVAIRRIRQGTFCHLDVLSRRVPEAVDLLTWLEEPRDEASTLLEETGGLICRLHAAGVEHVDLHVKNILLDRELKPCILDLDNARLRGTLSDRQKNRTYERFVRSLKKWLHQGRIVLPEYWELDLHHGYQAALR